jgi:O-antigen/teichoic acid export membrane protein
MPGQNKIRYISASGLLFVARAIGAAAMFGAQILLARMTSADTVALYFLATSLVTVAGTVAALGYPNIVVAMLGRYQNSRHGSRADSFIAVSRSDALITSAILGVILAVCIVAYPYTSWTERVSFLIALPAIPAVAMFRTNDVISRMRSLLATAYLPTILWRPLFFLFFAMFAAMVLHRDDAATYIALFAVIAIVGAVMQVAKLPINKSARNNADKRLARVWRRTATGFIAISVIDLLVIDMDVLLTGTLLPRQELAVFAICMKLAFFTKFAVDVLQDLVGPDMASCYARRDIAGLQRNITLSNLASVVSTLAMVFGAVLFSRPALAVFGPEYVSGQSALITLLAVQLVNAFGGPHVALLTLKGAQRRVNFGYAVAACLLVALNFVLVPLYGVLGAAFAVLAAYIALNVILAANVWLVLGIRSDVWNLVIFCFARRRVELPRAAA